MAPSYFLTTERLGFRCWSIGDLQMTALTEEMGACGVGGSAAVSASGADLRVGHAASRRLLTKLGFR